MSSRSLDQDLAGGLSEGARGLWPHTVRFTIQGSRETILSFEAFVLGFGDGATPTHSTGARHVLAPAVAVVAYLWHGGAPTHETTSQDDVAVGDSNAAVSSISLSLHLHRSSLPT